MGKRLTRKLTEVAREVEQTLKSHYQVKAKDIEAWQTAAKNLNLDFPDSKMVRIEDLLIDYEVQRDVIHDHVKNIMRKWNPQICSPVSACKIGADEKIYAYDGQHRTIAAAILGYESLPGAIVYTDNPQFPSEAFEWLNDTGIRSLLPGDKHRNALVRYKLGSREIKNVRARTMQDQFDALGIDLEDKNTRKSPALRGNNDYFFSHFKYAQKAIELDPKGKVLHNILNAIKTNFQTQEEIDQGVFIGLLELQRLAGTNANVKLPADWMQTLLASVKTVFKSSHLVHDKAKVQWEHKNPGATWSAPSAMSNFLRELHVHAGGKLNLPTHGSGASMGLLTNNAAPGLFPQGV